MARPRPSLILVLTGGSLIVALAMGLRQAFGIFLQPIGTDLGLGREVFGLAIAVQNLLFGVAQPLVGLLADRFGGWRIALAGGLLYAAGLSLAAAASDPLGLHLTLGVAVGLALSATTYVVVLGAVGRVVAPRWRSTAFGVTTAAGSFGMFALIPGAQWLLDGFGWVGAFQSLALVALVIGLCAPALRPAERAQSVASDDHGLPLDAAIGAARGHRGYWRLNLGFFVCGFHVAFIATHFPAYLTDQGLSPQQATLAFSLIGLFNVFGSFGFGLLGDRFRKRTLLSLLYFTRAAVFALLLGLPLTAHSALLFGAVIGFLWLATVPLTSGIVAGLFGVRSLATLYGIVFMSHQFGSFLGAWLGGKSYDLLGSYDAIWIASIVLGLMAGWIHLRIDDRPVTQPA